MFENVSAYWLEGRFFQRLNYYPWKPSYWRQLITLSKQALKTEHIDRQVFEGTLDDVWIAPYVFQNTQGDCVVPIWIPAKIVGNQFQLREDASYPFMPGIYFDPLGPCHIWDEPVSAFDAWLRFELAAENAPMHWEVLYQQCLKILDELSNNSWRDKIADKGFVLSDKCFVLPVQKISQSIQLSPLQKSFSTFSEEDGMEPQLVTEQSVSDKLSSMTTGSWAVFPFTRGDPKQSEAIASIRKELLSQQRTCVRCHFDPQRGMMLWRISADDAVQWTPLKQMEPCDVVLVMEAEKLLPGQLFRFLSYAESAIFIGDPHAMTLSPLWGGYQESRLLKKHHLSDDHLEEALDFRGMQVATGSSLQVAITHPEYGCDFMPEPRSVSVHFVDKAGKPEILLDGLCNPEQATLLAAWLQVQFCTHKMHPTSAHIVTLFAAQKRCLMEALSKLDVSVPVYTVAELPAKRVKDVVLSSVYTQSQPRPFLLDVGESLWAQLQSAADERLWVVGDIKIFDPKCHSPTGILAKKWLEPDKISLCVSE